MNRKTSKVIQYHYAPIIFMEGEEAEEPLRLLKKKSVLAAVRYLSQWDCGEYYDVREEPAKGTSDNYEVHMGYLISWNSFLGYIGLEKILPAS